jgi:ABC-2 type transport system permease protein
LINKGLAFISRDLIIATSYKLAFFLRFFGIFFSILIFYFIDLLFGNSAVTYLESYGGDYFSFVLIGIAFTGFLWTGLRSFSKTIRRGQMIGTLEAMLVTPTRISTIILLSSFWRFLSTSLGAVIYLLIGAIFFGVNMRNANIPSVVIVLLLTILAFSSLGILSASFIMVYKEGDPINWILSSLSSLLGGVFFPISVMPLWLQKFSYLLPITYSLNAMRLAILKGLSPFQLTSDILPLIVFSVIFIPLSIISFNFAVKKAKVNGTLAHY